MLLGRDEAGQDLFTQPMHNGLRRELAIEIGVRPDPIPDHRLSLFPRDRSVASAYPNCPGVGIAAQTLQREAGMGWVRGETLERLACLCPHLNRQRMI